MNKKLLLVEDHDSLRILLASFLSKTFDVSVARNGLEALSLLSKGDIPDLIVTDVHMPEFSGVNFLNSIKSSGIFNKIPVVLISGSSNADIKYTATLDICDYFTKPLNPEHFKQRLIELTTLSTENVASAA